MTLTIKNIQFWLKAHQKRLQHGEPVIPISDIAYKSGISRQTLYAVLNGERTEFGQVAQIRLSRVINQISSEPNYQLSKMARIDLNGVSPKIKFGV